MALLCDVWPWLVPQEAKSPDGPLPELPNEMWEAIFKRVDPVTMCKAVPGVCRRWQALANRALGPTVTVQSLDDIRRAEKLPKVYCVRVATKTVGNPQLKCVYNIQMDSIFSELADVLNRTKYLHLRHKIATDSVEEWVVRNSKVIIIGGGGVTIKRFCYGSTSISRCGDLQYCMNRAIDMPGLS